MGLLLRAGLGGGNSLWRTGRGWMGNHLVVVLDTLECLGLEGAAWVVVSVIVSFLEGGLLIFGRW